MRSIRFLPDPTTATDLPLVRYLECITNLTNLINQEQTNQPHQPRTKCVLVSERKVTPRMQFEGPPNLLFSLHKSDIRRVPVPGRLTAGVKKEFK